MILTVFLLSLLQLSFSEMYTKDTDKRLNDLEIAMAERILELEAEIFVLKKVDSETKERLSLLENKLGISVPTPEEPPQEINEPTDDVENTEGQENHTDITNGRNISKRDVESYASMKLNVKRKFQKHIPRIFRRSTVVVPKTSFYAYMSSHQSNPGVHNTLIFDTVVNNEGDAYEGRTGVFRAPVDGVYVFSYSISTQGSWRIPVEIMKNFSVYGSSVSSSYLSSYKDNAASVVVMEMRAGDHCYVRTGSTETPSGSIFSSQLARSSFAGWLL